MELSEYLRRRGLTRKEFANQSGIAERTVYRVICGSVPTVEIAKQIEAATGGEIKAAKLLGVG